jgi:hypothetical protein
MGEHENILILLPDECQIDIRSKRQDGISKEVSQISRPEILKQKFSVAEFKIWKRSETYNLIHAAF